MAHSTSALSFVTVLVFFSLVKIEARESKFFTKAVVLHANNTTKNVTHHVETPSPSPSPAPVEAEISGGYGLYGRDQVPNTSDFTSDSLFENKIPTPEFNQKFGKDEFDNSGLPSNYNEHSYVTGLQGDNKNKFDNEEFANNGLPSNYNQHSYVTVREGDNKERFDNQEFSNNGLPSNYNEHGDNKEKFDNEEFGNNGLPGNYNERSYVTVPEGGNKEKFDNNNELPSNYNEHSYVTVPQGTNLYDTKLTPTATNYENEFTNNEEKLTPEEEKLFDENRNNNQRTENSFVNLNEPQKLSETPKYAEMDNYFNDNHNHNTYNRDTYSVKEPQGMSDTRTLENGKYYYTLNGDGRQRGYVKGGPGSSPKYNSEGYYGNNKAPKSKYEFDTMEEYEKQEGFSQIPGEYINP
ncbi:uncharacterized protein LOC141700035 [Apium graveolens]|uniref:Uncharacterized protein n=1 Tax=Apium graveolens TaxID=4045 RepID=A0A6L5BBH2_APIGR|nr:hypothetical protein AG4045_009448 [Apium graveolens]